MNLSQFRDLCRGAARVLDLADVEALFDDAAVRIDNVHVGVFHKVDADPPGVYCYADLGPADPGANAADLMEEALALNLELEGPVGAVIGLERESRHFVLRVHVAGDAESIDAQDLAEELRTCAKIANELYEKVLVGVVRPQ